jgi:hypothetical protein
MTRQNLCPSVTGERDEPTIIGFIGDGGVVANIPTPIPLTADMRASTGPRPERIFRLADTCGQSDCANWQNAQCALIQRMYGEVARRGVAIAGPDAKLPRCGIRADCVWWRQEGPQACRVCPHVIYNPSS